MPNRFGAVNAWAELPREVHAEDGSADEAHLRAWLDEGWLRPKDLVELHGQRTTFEGAYLAVPQLNDLSLKRGARLSRRLGWALLLPVGVLLALRLFLAVRRVP